MSNKRILNNKKRKIKNREIILTTLASTMIAVPITIGISQIKTNYSINNQSSTSSFGNKDQLFNDIKNKSVKKNYMIEDNNSKWKVTLNNEVKYFTDTKSLNDFLKQTYNVQSKSYKSSIDLNSFVDEVTGILNINGDNSRYLSDATASTKKVYEGKNGKIYDTEESAKKSYFEAKDYLSFNGMYFKNKNDLNQYLQNEYFANKNPIANNIIIEAPNGLVSSPINLSNKTAYKDAETFIKDNAEVALEYTNSSTNKKMSLTKGNYESFKNDISIKDLSYQHILSNQGESRYVIDNSIDDEFNLIGPYFYKGNLDIGNFMNKSMWKKTTNVSKQVYQESKVDAMIGDFFTSILNDDNQLNKEENKEENKAPTIFRTLLTVDGKLSLDEWYLDQLKAYDENLWKDVISNNESLMNGKKYNTFYKMPIMYSFILQRLIDMNASWDIIDTTFYYFGEVADFIQACIESVVLNDDLLIGKNNKKFNVREFFNIGNSEFDTSTSMEYFINEIKKYDKFMAAMAIYLGAVNNLNTLAGLIPFNASSLNILFDNKVITREEFYNQKNYDLFKNVYNAYSKLNYEEFLKDYTKNSKDENIRKLFGKPHQEVMDALNKIFVKDNITLNAILQGVVSKNIITYEVNKSALMGEIEEYKKTGKVLENGLLERLQVINKLDPFLKLLENDKDGLVDPFRAYIAINLNEVVTPNQQVFDTNQSISNPQLFATNIVRLAAGSLVSAGVVADVINNLYWKAWKHSHEFNRPASSIGKAVRYVYSKVNQAFVDLKNKTKNWFYRVNDAVDGLTFTVEKWSSLKYFKKLDRGLDFIKKVAPVFGAAFAAFEVAMIIFEFLKVEETQNYYIYTAADGTEFIWDGSKTVSRYFGFDVQEVGSIDNMKLVTPVQITTPQIEDFYFFDKVRYYSQEEIKPKLISYLFDGKPLKTNKNFIKKYTFTNDLQSNNNGQIFGTIDEMVASVMKDIGITKNEDGSINNSNINLNSQFLKTSSFAFDSGLIVSSDEAKNDTIQNILKYIRSTKIAKLNTTNNTKDEFVVPGKLWSNGAIIDNSNLSSQYVIDNSANEFATTGSKVPLEINGKLLTENSFKEKDRTIAERKSYEALYKAFATKTTINSKDVLSNVNLPVETFSQIQGVKTTNVYTIVVNGQELSFLDSTKATTYLNKVANVSKISNYVQGTSYLYNDMFFANEQTLREWVNNNF